MPLGANKVALFGVAGVSTGTAVLLSTATASDDASIEFTLPTAYKQVKFGFYNIAPATDNAHFQFQVNATDDPGGDYDVSLITSTYFRAEHYEDDSATGLAYHTSYDLAQSASFQTLAQGVGNGADESCAGIMHLFSPSSTTYVKHFYARFSNIHYIDLMQESYVGGYINDTTAIDDIRFQMSSGNISSGTIKMWGIK